MSIRFALLCVVAACGHAPPTTPETRPATLNPACVAAVRAVRDLALADWRGLPACTRADVESVLGPLPKDGAYRGWPDRLEQIEPHYDGERLEALGISKPKLRLDTFGAPEAVDRSSFYDYKQFIFSSRGAAAFGYAHLEIQFLYLFAPMTLEQYRQSWMWSTQMWEEPMR